MSNKNVDTENPLFRFFRINFVGRPLELYKLVFDDNVLVENEEEVDKIVKAFGLHNGHKYLGYVSSLATLSFFAATPITKIRTSFKLLISFIPMIPFHIYSYFVYWDNLRDVVKITRERVRRVDSKEDMVFKLNVSKDNHRKIREQIGVFDCLNITINHYLGKN